MVSFLYGKLRESKYPNMTQFISFEVGFLPRSH